VVTNNMNVANILVANPGCEIMVAGGRLRRTDGGLVGELTTQFFEQFKVDYAVIGTSALDRDGDLLDFDLAEVRVSGHHPAVAHALSGLPTIPSWTDQPRRGWRRCPRSPRCSPTSRCPAT
jgi:hypothetical protein